MAKIRQGSTRRIDCSELSDKLRALKDQGVDIPELRYSIEKPTYMHTDDFGIEVYVHEGKIVNVGPEQVIDDHGNVVNLVDLTSFWIIQIVSPSMVTS